MQSKRFRGTCLLDVLLCIQPVRAQLPRATLKLYLKADVQADGVPINIAPDPALEPALQAMVRKWVAGWRYEVGRYSRQAIRF